MLSASDFKVQRRACTRDCSTKERIEQLKCVNCKEIGRFEAWKGCKALPVISISGKRQPLKSYAQAASNQTGKEVNTDSQKIVNNQNPPPRHLVAWKGSKASPVIPISGKIQPGKSYAQAASNQTEKEVNTDSQKIVKNPPPPPRLGRSERNEKALKEIKELLQEFPRPRWPSDKVSALGPEGS
ncbi:hypothetical protein AVEN_226762-1, partial [Araneus ventricosus]